MKCLNIEEVHGGVAKENVRQDFKFKTGKFVWRVKFNIPLDPKTINSNNLYVRDTDGKIIGCKINYDVENCMIEIEPEEAYAEDVEYQLFITTRVRSKGGQFLPREVSLKFTL